MEITKFTTNQLRFLIELNKKGSVTIKTQTIYTPFAFYLNKGDLEKKNLIINDGVNEKNQKIWKLTDKGKRFIEHLEKIEKILGEF